jgi:Ca-activated chloride channel family protein
MKLVPTLLTCVLLVAPGLAQNAPVSNSSSDEQEPTTTFKSNVKLVNVFTTVVNKRGAPVAGLKKEDFAIAEDGVPQEIKVFDRESELPLNIVLAIDTSLSTRKDIRLELDSARRFVHALLRPVDSLALFQFSENVDELVPFTSNLQRIDKGIDRVRIGAATALYDAIYLGSHSLADRNNRKVMLVITDGGDTMSKIDFNDAVRAAQESEAIVYSIIIVPIEADAGRNVGGENALIQLSDDTGGKHYYASGITQLDAAFHQVSQELRTQYLIGYYPKKKLSDSDFRHIEVTLTDPNADYKVRHRTGYYTK